MDDVKKVGCEILADDEHRVYHSHGSSLKEMYELCFGSLGRVCDLVIYPTSHEMCVEIVNLALKHNVVLSPFGGGTNVTEALE